MKSLPHAALDLVIVKLLVQVLVLAWSLPGPNLVLTWS